MSPLLEIRGLAKRFGDLQVLRGIDISVADRGVHSIIGPNGAGKTTLFNCISGTVAPDAGTITLNGSDITRVGVVGRIRLGLARTFQVSRVFESMSALDNVRIALTKTELGNRVGLGFSATRRRAIERRSHALLDEVGFAHRARGTRAGEISHADRRAVEVAMGLACDPILLCLDEPTAGVGIGEAQRLAELIGQLGARLAVLLVEHRMSLVQEVSDQVSVLAFGSLLANGSPEAVAADPRVQDAYLGRVGGGRRMPVASTRPKRTAHGEAGDRGLVLRGVHTYYGSSHVLHGIDLVAREGEVSSVLGRNGAGKTTTLATVMNLVRARSGSIRFGPRELVGLSTHAVAAAGIALVPEERWVFPELTVEENIRVAGGRRDTLAEAYSEFPALADRRAANGSELSGGQQQMVAFARALVRRPSIVLLDEPTQGLSPQYVEIVVQHILSLRERGVTVILVEQNLDVVAAVSDTVYLMADGQVGAQLSVAELASNQALVQSYLLLDSSGSPRRSLEPEPLKERGEAVCHGR